MKTEVKKWIEKDGVEFLKNIGIRKGNKVLDYGSGEGHYTIPAAKIVGKHGKIYAMDKDEESLHYIDDITHLNNIVLLNSKTKIPLEANSIDYVLCYDMLHYFEKREMVYKEVRRVLKNNGIFSVYPHHHKDNFPRRGFAHLSLEEIITEIEKNGFLLKRKKEYRLLHDNYYKRDVIVNFILKN
ncbi:MAG: class I SAM-dependent methyltransferase [Elusimicrobiota bacterium]